MTGERERKIRKKIPCERELGGNMGGGEGEGENARRQVEEEEEDN